MRINYRISPRSSVNVTKLYDIMNPFTMNPFIVYPFIMNPFYIMNT